MKDRFEDILKDKLHGAQQAPSDQVWERLSRSLADIRREEAFNGQGDATPAEKPSIRRPQRRRFSWTYVAASVAALGVLFMVTRNIDSTEPNNPTAQSNGTSITVPDTATGSATAPQNTSSLASNDGPDSSVRTTTGGKKSRTIIRTPGEGDSTPTISITDIYNGGDEIAEEGGRPEEVTTPDMTDAPSGMESDNRKALTQQEMQELLASNTDSDKTRNRAPSTDRRISAGLYAGNSPAGNGGRSATSSNNPMANIPQIILTDAYEYDLAAIMKDINSGVDMKHDYPISAGISVSIPITDRLSIQTGLTYTYMKSDGSVGKSEGSPTYTEVEQKMHYLGIPVALKYDFLTAGRFVLYGSAGGSVEKCISGKRSESLITNGKEIYHNKFTERGKGLQTSVGASLGAEFRISNTFGIYVEPGVSYFFKNSNQPESYRTENPLNFSAKAGLRINL